MIAYRLSVINIFNKVLDEPGTSGSFVKTSRESPVRRHSVNFDTDRNEVFEIEV